MDKMLRFTNNAIEYLFLTLLVIVPFIFTPSTSELFELPKMFLVYAIAILIFFAWSVKLTLSDKLIFRRTILDIPLLLFLLSLLLSTFSSTDVHTSIWGYYSRFTGGLLPTLAYAFLYWAYVSNMTRSATVRSIRALLLSAVLISVYAILEHFGHSYSCLILHNKFDTSCWAPKVQERVFATLGQPNWLAAWLVAILPLSWTLFFTPNFPKFPNFPNYLKLILPLTLSSLLLAAVLFTKSRSGLLGLGTAFAIFWSLAFLTRPTKKLVFLFVILITSHLSLIAIFGSPWSPPLGSVTANKYAYSVVAHFNARGMNSAITTYNPQSVPTGTKSGDIRKIVWKGSVNIWKHYPILGSGPETFAYTYYNFRPVEHNLTSEWDLLYNKAHNEYLNYLANTGAIGLLAYLSLIGTFVVFCLGAIWRSSRLQSATVALLAGYISILVTNFFGFSVVTTSLLFFLFPAMAETATSDKLQVTSYKPGISLLKLLLLLLLLPVTYYLLLKTYGFFHADQLYTQAKRYNEKDAPKEATKTLKKALLLNPGEPKYYDESADSASRIAVLLAEDNQKDKAKEFAALAKELDDQALVISPRNVSFWSARSIYFKKLAIVDSSYLNLAIQALEKAVLLAPTDPTLRLNLAVLYNHAGNSDHAIKTLEETVNLKPNYNQARDDLARLYLEKGEKQKAFEQVRYVIEKINPRDKDARALLDRLSAP